MARTGFHGHLRHERCAGLAFRGAAVHGTTVGIGAVPNIDALQSCSRCSSPRRESANCWRSTGEVSRLDGTPGRRGLADDGRARPARARQFIPIAGTMVRGTWLSEWSRAPRAVGRAWTVPVENQHGPTQPTAIRVITRRKCKRRCSKSKTIFARTREGRLNAAQGHVRNIGGSAWRLDQGVPRLRTEERKRLAKGVLRIDRGREAPGRRRKQEALLSAQVISRRPMTVILTSRTRVLMSRIIDIRRHLMAKGNLAVVGHIGPAMRGDKLSAAACAGRARGLGRRHAWRFSGS